MDSETTSFLTMPTSTLPPIIQYTPFEFNNIAQNLTCTITKEWSSEYNTFSKVVNGYLTALIVLSGSVANIVSIVYVRFASLERNIGAALAIALIVLGIWDTALLWSALCYYGAKSLFPAPVPDFLTQITPIFHAFSQISNTASIWSVVTITVQRYMATTDPFRTTRWLLYVASCEINEQNRVMLYSFRSVGGATSSGNSYSTKNRQSLPDMWRFVRKCRHRCRLPILISAIAIFINIPAFFEISALPCLVYPTESGIAKFSYMLQISRLRLNSYYKLLYKVIFRMLATSCFPNIFILCLTVRTVLLLHGSNRSRKQLFHMNETAIERYSSCAKMLTMISVTLVVKFLLFRSLAFVLDIWEVTVGLPYCDPKPCVPKYLYLVDISNFLVLLNSSTNCLIIFRGSQWLHEKINERSTERREKQLGINNVNSRHKVILLHEAWRKALKLTNLQFGSRILYAILLKNPRMFTAFEEHLRRNSLELPSSVEKSLYSPKTKHSIQMPLKLECATSHAIRSSSLSHDSESKNGANILLSIETPLLKSCEDLDYEASTIPPDDPAPLQNPLSIKLIGPLNSVESSDVSELDNSSPSHNNMSKISSTLCHQQNDPAQIQRINIFLAKNERFRVLSDQIYHFIDEIIGMMLAGKTEQVISERIKEIGKIHQEKGITFTSSAWKEFKTTALAIIGNCEYASEMIRSETMEAWGSLLSVIIRDMKLGMLNGKENETSTTNYYYNNPQMGESRKHKPSVGALTNSKRYSIPPKPQHFRKKTVSNPN